ncbi:MAG TPA: hypothetical protein DEF47_04970 [Herpetosiphon sp.]|uniref:Uncharacterized protein n=1 Tax=Herpetosiphon aurantiacus (strain ATCC 23779 / DSM 785 / 114-95) TaxID=316274 RepID=A9B2J2_HERA2|nr:hypothetical protein [Herpetosiphon sp.]ABX04037.1 hypothetical protein Haur_1392 [Herpetosiphon aurantiacus DSM 785]HBW49234.1 hypothetical protein [Herpetosiphon sp.]
MKYFNLATGTHDNPLWEHLHTTKEGKPFAMLSRRSSPQHVLYLVPDLGESAEHLIEIVDALVITDSDLVLVDVFNQDHTICWRVARETRYGYPVESVRVSHTISHGCYACGYTAHTGFDQCPRCSMQPRHDVCGQRWMDQRRHDLENIDHIDSEGVQP